MATNMPVTPQSAPKTNSEKMVTNRLMLSDVPASRGSRMLPITNCTSADAGEHAERRPDRLELQQREDGRQHGAEDRADGRDVVEEEDRRGEEDGVLDARQASSTR